MLRAGFKATRLSPVLAGVHSDFWRLLEMYNALPQWPGGLQVLYLQRFLSANIHKHAVLSICQAHRDGGAHPREAAVEQERDTLLCRAPPRFGTSLRPSFTHFGKPPHPVSCPKQLLGRGARCHTCRPGRGAAQAAAPRPGRPHERGSVGCLRAAG